VLLAGSAGASGAKSSAANSSAENSKDQARAGALSATIKGGGSGLVGGRAVQCSVADRERGSGHGHGHVWQFTDHVTDTHIFLSNFNSFGAETELLKWSLFTQFLSNFIRAT
jgi:hypothetical protein